MSATGGLDVRWPIGGLFTALGLLLAGYGFASAGSANYERSLGININLWWGAVMLLFGVVLLVSASRSRRRPRTSPEGRAVEERERRLGLEREPGS